MTNFKHSLLLLATLVVHFAAHAKVISEVIQTGEMGVEQADSFLGSAVITFFAAARAGFDFSSESYVLSFGEATLENSCTQSLTDICTDNVSIATGWESTVIAHYPTENFGGALYIRRSVNLLDEEDCVSSGFTRTVINDTTIQIDGTLVLSSFSDCAAISTTSPFLKIRTYPFSIVYDSELGQLSGLSYDLLSYAYTTKTKRIINSPVYGTLIELEVFTERIVDSALIANSSEPAQPSRLTGAVVVNQDMEADLMIAAVSPCMEEVGTVCTQTIVFALENRHLFDAEGNLTGSLEMKAMVFTPGDEFQSAIQLRAIFDVDTKVETGELSRLYDVFLTVEKTFFDSIGLYIKDAENSTAMTTQTKNCVNVIRLDHQHLDIHSIFLYADDPADEEVTLLTVLYVPGRVSQGTYHRDSDWSARFCFRFSSLIAMPGDGLSPLWVQVDYGQKSDVQFFRADTVEENAEYSEDPLTGVMTLQRRSLYNPTPEQVSGPGQDEVSDPQLLYMACPYAGQCYYHGYCMRCDGWGTDDVSTATWVFLAAILAIVLIGLIALCWCYPGSDSASSSSSSSTKGYKPQSTKGSE